MRGKGHKRLAEKAFQQWRRLHFDLLCDGRLMPTPQRATLRLPVHVLDPAPSALTSSGAPAAIDIHLSTNHRGVTSWWEDEYDAFLRPATPEPCATSEQSTIMATTRVATHVGPPASPLGYPAYLRAEAQQWTEGVLRGETYAYQHADSDSLSAPPSPRGSAYLSPVRWLQQPLLDGVVAQRLTAHAGVTTPALLEARRAGAALGRQLPPFDLSPFYGASDLLDRWCLFGEASAVLPAPPAEGPAAVAGTHDATAAAHHRRVADLAVAAAVLPNYNAAWLNAAVVTDARAGRSVLVVGPRHCGKTTLALHCAAAVPGLQLTAVEHVCLGAGSPVRRMLHAPPAATTTAAALPSVFACALPHRVTVGIGAVLGTLRPNPGLAAITVLPPPLRSEAGLRAFLANSDERIWQMSMRYQVRLQDVCSNTAAWQPAAVSGLAGVVLLDWDVGELAATTATSVHTRVRRLPLHDGGIEELLTRGRDYLFRGHQLVRSVYDGAADGPARLADALTSELDAMGPVKDASAAPALHCLEGSVNFDAAVQLVRDLLAV